MAGEIYDGAKLSCQYSDGAMTLKLPVPKVATPEEKLIKKVTILRAVATVADNKAFNFVNGSQCSAPPPGFRRARARPSNCPAPQRGSGRAA